MARVFNGTNENINFGSDASVDGDGSTTFVNKTIAFWYRKDSGGASTHTLFGKASNTAWQFAAGSSTFFFAHGFSTANGVWTSATATSIGALVHIVVTYNNSSVSNDPDLFFNGALDTETETTTPVGTTTGDAANDLKCGENTGGGNDMCGAILALCYDDTIWTSAQRNRHRWWGRTGGSVKVRHPFLTSKLINEGTATATGTATGTTVGSLPRVMRPGCGGW